MSGEKEFPVPVVAEESPKRSLVRKLCEVMDAIGWVAKTGYNEFHKYHYAQEADLVNAIRGELAKRHIFIFSSVTKTVRSPLEVETMKWDESVKMKVPTIRKTQLTEIEMDWTFVDGESGEERTVRFDGVGEDNVDKGLYKAMTGCEKYLLMKSFLVPTGDDPEKDSSEDAKNAKEEGVHAAKAVAESQLEAYKRREKEQLTETQDHKFFTQAAAPATVAAALPKRKFADTANDDVGEDLLFCQRHALGTVRGPLVKVAEAKSKSGVYLRLRVGDTDMSLWDNLKFESPVRGCKDLFSLLATSINETCDFEIDTKPGPAGKTYINVRVKSATMLIGPVEIDDCLPVIRREAGAEG